MSREQPERPGTARFLAALGVRRNATVGFAVGFLVGLFFTYGAVTGPGAFFGLTGAAADVAALALGFVLAVGVGLLVTLLITVGSAIRLARAD